MTKSQTISSVSTFQRQTTNFFKELEQTEAKKLEYLKKKVTVLNEELASINGERWDVIETKKKRQLELIETRKKEFQSKGMWSKKLFVNQKRKKKVDPQVLSLLKRCVKITDDLEAIQKGQYSFYLEKLRKRIESSIQKIGRIESNEVSLNFQLDLIPLYKHADSLRKGEPEPWCLTAFEHNVNPQVPLGLPSSKPLYHILDQSRTYLNKKPTVIESESVGADGQAPSSSAAQFMAQMKSARNKKKPTNPTNAIQVLDASAQLKSFQNLLGYEEEVPPNFCPECKTVVEWEKDSKHGVMICSRCATMQSVATHCKESTYGLVYDFIVPFHYEKRNHFIDCLRQRQAKEESNIPPSVFQIVRAEIHRRQITDPTVLRPKHIRKIMKAVGLNNYYDHEIMIWSIVTGSKPPQFNEMQEKVLIRMFDDSIEPYMRYKGERHNYLTYSFAIHKMLEILDWAKEIREFYPVLRSDTKRIDQEQIWHRICVDLGWAVIKTEQQFIDDAKN